MLDLMMMMHKVYPILCKWYLNMRSGANRKQLLDLIKLIDKRYTRVSTFNELCVECGRATALMRVSKSTWICV